MPNKGRIDSTSTNEVTVINTILNKNLTVTDEGNAIRRRIELELQLDESPKDNLEIMKIMKNAPDMSSRFYFSNGVLCFVHPIFSSFGFWYFGHFSFVIFFLVFFRLAHLILQNVNKDYVTFL